uniref:THIF-type NAD/FAD binding fold domain-containing protein n=1 Tax=Ditylenchus dipsaci TaxID=166011 RepID=A0A915CVT7_9BILA
MDAIVQSSGHWSWRHRFGAAQELALTGFNNITVIDLDTIDISNLNRQFCFAKNMWQRKGRSGRKIWRFLFPTIAIVLSALDNKGARSHVNRLCLVSGVPLVESGSAGYLGQVSVIMKGKSECYDCVPKSGQKTYPNCTIRNTPSEPIHCVVWAKALFNQLFGEKDPDNDVAPEIDDSSSAQNLPGSSESKPNRIDTRTFAENSYYDAALLFNKLFHDDVNYLLKMADLWKERKKPTAVLFADVTDGDDGILSWDKDDEPSMKFSSKSLFDVKSMAGNIIPAIATTNACVAGMIVVEALKIVRGQFDKSKNVFIGRVPNPRGKILVMSRHTSQIRNATLLR